MTWSSAKKWQHGEMNSLDVATCVHLQAINKANLQKCPDRFSRVLGVVFFEDVFGSMGINNGISDLCPDFGTSTK